MKIEMFTAPDCAYCEAAKSLLEARGLSYAEHNIADEDAMTAFRARLPRVKSIPQIFFDDVHIGGFEDLELRAKRGELPAS